MRNSSTPTAVIGSTSKAFIGKDDDGIEVKITFDNGYVNFYDNGVKCNPDDKPLRTNLDPSAQNASKLYYDYVRMENVTFAETRIIRQQRV